MRALIRRAFYCSSLRLARTGLFRDSLCFRIWYDIFFEVSCVSETVTILNKLRCNKYWKKVLCCRSVCAYEWKARWLSVLSRFAQSWHFSNLVCVFVLLLNFLILFQIRYHNVYTRIDFFTEIHMNINKRPFAGRWNRGGYPTCLPRTTK